MKNSVRHLILLLLGGALATATYAGGRTLAGYSRRPGSQIIIRVSDPAGPKPGRFEIKEGSETVAFLGVETAPVGRTLARQLGLGRDLGLVVTRLAEDSPAAAVLKEDDILTKLDDQLLVDSHQLGVLIRSRKEGDEVTLTVVRGGKETTVKTRLGKHDVPKTAGLDFGPDSVLRFFDGKDLPGLQRVRELPGMAREDVDNALRLIGRERGNWFSPPRVHVFNHRGSRDATVLDMAQGNFVYSDEDGSVELNAQGGKRELTVKNAKGKVTYQGSINNDEERKKLPPEVMARLNKIEQIDVDFQPGEDFEQEGAAVEPPARAKIRQPLDRDRERAPNHAVRPF